MSGYLFVIVSLILLLLALAVFVSALRGVLRLWLDYRVKRSFLERLRDNPELMPHDGDIPKAVDALGGNGAGEGDGSRSVHHVLTGVILALIGLAGILAGQALRFGVFAVGLYIGGWIAVVLGGVLSAAALALHLLSRRQSPSP